MSAKELLEGMCYVDERFVDEAEHQTLQKKPVRIWTRLLPVAACLCILVAGAVAFWDQLPYPGDSAESMNEGQEETVNYPGAGEGKPMSVMYYKQYIRTDGGNETTEYPSYEVIRSKEDLNQYYEEKKDIFDLERRENGYADSTIGFLDACDQYDDAFFTNMDLIILVVEEGSGSIRHSIYDIRPYYENSWQLVGYKIVPEICTDDMAQWHIMIAIDKDLVDEDDILYLNWVD